VFLWCGGIESFGLSHLKSFVQDIVRLNSPRLEELNKPVKIRGEKEQRLNDYVRQSARLCRQNGSGEPPNHVMDGLEVWFGFLYAIVPSLTPE
jgi:hypothetical protein